MAQLAALHTCARRAERGHGCIAFVVGEAGSGKTCLLHAFADQLRRSDAGWLCALGSCTALFGIGERYQPFMDVVRALASHEADAPGSNLSSAADLLTERQGDCFDQLTRSLERLAQRYPLLLVLDNLHWADDGTMALLFHLVQRLSHRRVMFVGAYRSNSLSEAERCQHLVTAVQELRQQPGGAMIDLDQADGRQFVDALLDLQPNHLGEQFRHNLIRHTEGHALFTVELLHALQVAGHLTRGTDGYWQIDGDPDWLSLPPHVEAVIRERVDSLCSSDRDLLNVACVEGEEFTVEIAAAICGIDPRVAINRFSGVLTEHRLVYATGVQHFASISRSRFRFRHHLFRAFLYETLDLVQRDHLCRRVVREIDKQYVKQEFFLDM
jgi:predicted ATPase